MRHGKKMLVLLPALLVGLLLCGSAAADDALLGEWDLIKAGEVEPEEAQRLTFVFGAETVAVTVGSGDAEVTWEVAYTVSEGELTLEPGAGLGDPGEPTTYTYTITGDELVIKQTEDAPGLTFARPTGE